MSEEDNFPIPFSPLGSRQIFEEYDKFQIHDEVFENLKKLNVPRHDSLVKDYFPSDSNGAPSSSASTSIQNTSNIVVKTEPMETQSYFSNEFCKEAGTSYNTEDHSGISPEEHLNEESLNLYNEINNVISAMQAGNSGYPIDIKPQFDEFPQFEYKYNESSTVYKNLVCKPEIISGEDKNVDVMGITEKTHFADNTENFMNFVSTTVELKCKTENINDKLDVLDVKTIPMPIEEWKNAGPSEEKNIIGHVDYDKKDKLEKIKYENENVEEIATTNSENDRKDNVRESKDIEEKIYKTIKQLDNEREIKLNDFALEAELYQLDLDSFRKGYTLHYYDMCSIFQRNGLLNEELLKNYLENKDEFFNRLKDRKLASGPKKRGRKPRKRNSTRKNTTALPGLKQPSEKYIKKRFATKIEIVHNNSIAQNTRSKCVVNIDLFRDCESNLRIRRPKRAIHRQISQAQKDEEMAQNQLASGLDQVEILASVNTDKTETVTATQVSNEQVEASVSHQPSNSVVKERKRKPNKNDVRKVIQPSYYETPKSRYVAEQKSELPIHGNEILAKVEAVVPQKKRKLVFDTSAEEKNDVSEDL